MPKVSVIITTIKRPSLLKALMSVINQTYQDWEMIVVNDCPDNLTLQIDERIKIINNGKNLGGTKSLNIGIDNAKGEYIAILDDDDEWISENKLEKQVEVLDKDKKVIAVGTGIEGLSLKEKIPNLEGTPFPHSSLMFRNNGIRYNEKLPRAKDLDLILNLKKMGYVKMVEDVFIRYKVNNTLKQKINDCHWHRKVVLMHKEFPDWFSTYINLCLREIKLRRYALTIGLRKIGGEQEK